jgi:hypothetical protein
MWRLTSSVFIRVNPRHPRFPSFWLRLQAALKRPPFSSLASPYQLGTVENELDNLRE